MSKFKITTHVPSEVADQVRDAAGAVGAGTQGNYTHCSFSIKGIGRFKPGEGANPHIGEVGKLEEIEEELIEFVCEESIMIEVIEAIKQAQPYEEPYIEVVKLEHC